MKLGVLTYERSEFAQRRRDFKFSSSLKNPLIYFNDAQQSSAFRNLPMGSYGSTLLGKILIGDITHAGAKGPFPLFQPVRVRSRSDDMYKKRIRTRRTVSFNVLL